MEAGEDLPNFLGSPKVGQSVSDGITVFEPQQGRELLLVEFFHADADVV